MQGGEGLLRAAPAAGHAAVLTALRLAGGCGPLLMASGAAMGLAWPDLATLARTLFPVAILALTFTAFLRVSPAELVAAVGARWQLTLAVLTWTTLGAPLAVAVAVHAAGLTGDVAAAAVLAAAGPTSLGAVGVAIILRLDPVLPAAAALLGIVLAPVTVPALSVAVLGAQPAIDPAAMALRLLAVVAVAAALAAAVRRTHPRVAANPAVTSNLAALSLTIFAIGGMVGMQEQAASHPAQLALLAGVALACNAGAQLAGALLFARLGAHRALAIGVASGSRNVSMQWSALGAAADGPIATYFALCLILHTLLPLLQQAVMSSIKAAMDAARRPSRAPAAAR